jgi:hypothetical protein
MKTIFKEKYQSKIIDKNAIQLLGCHHKIHCNVASSANLNFVSESNIFTLSNHLKIRRNAMKQFANIIGLIIFTGVFTFIGISLLSSNFERAACSALGAVSWQLLFKYFVK